MNQWSVASDTLMVMISSDNYDRAGELEYYQAKLCLFFLFHSASLF